MARIPDSEIERLKREVSLVRLLEGQGHVLVKYGERGQVLCLASFDPSRVEFRDGSPPAS